MKITPLAISNPQNFGSRLFDSDGNQIRTTIYNFGKSNILADHGHKNTDIFIKEINSIPNKFGKYDNQVFLNLTNPLFGTQEISLNLTSTNSKLNKLDSGKVLDRLSVDKICESLEDNCLKKSLIESLKQNIKLGNDSSMLLPRRILTEMLEKTSENGIIYPVERIQNFYRIADEILTKLIKLGLQSLK